MKKIYISPFTKVSDASMATKILSGSGSSQSPFKSQAFGNKASGAGFDPDEEYGIDAVDGDISNLSKQRSGFYESY